MSEERKCLHKEHKSGSTNSSSTSQSGIQNPESKDTTQNTQLTHGLLSHTRWFGAWLTSKASEKVDVSSKDLNTVAPSTY